MCISREIDGIRKARLDCLSKSNLCVALDETAPGAMKACPIPQEPMFSLSLQLVRMLSLLLQLA